MNKKFNDFPKISKEQWEEVLIKELKGADLKSTLSRKDSIENIEYSCYNHTSDDVEVSSGSARSLKSENNDWLNTAYVKVLDEKSANEHALKLLMIGADALVFDIRKEQVDWELLFQDISFEYIQADFIILSTYQVGEIFYHLKEYQGIKFRFDIHKFGKDELDYVSKNCINQNVPFCFVNAFSIQQTGANISQELTFALSTAHEYLLFLLEQGLSVEQADKLIHVSLGVGKNYFMEISKFRVFRKLWLNILNQYDDSVLSSSCIISGEIGFVNKSLKDPYTNLLRQTTESMSAIIGGVNSILVYPYDLHAQKRDVDFTDRMSLNIPLILKNESYLDKVIDPVGGSYSIENITNSLSNLSWDLFKEIERLGGVLNAEGKGKLVEKISETISIRKVELKENKSVLIGVNKFPNISKVENDWKKTESYFGLTSLILERDI